MLGTKSENWKRDLTAESRKLNTEAEILRLETANCSQELDSLGTKLHPRTCRVDFLGGREIQILEVGKSRFLGHPEFWDLEIQKFGNQHMKNKSQNSNPFRPKCRQGLDK